MASETDRCNPSVPRDPSLRAAVIYRLWLAEAASPYMRRRVAAQLAAELLGEQPSRSDADTVWAACRVYVRELPPTAVARLAQRFGFVESVRARRYALFGYRVLGPWFDELVELWQRVTSVRYWFVALALATWAAILLWFVLESVTAVWSA